MESSGFPLSWRGRTKGFVLSLSLSVVVFLILVSSSAWFSSHRIWEIMDIVCLSFSLTSNVRSGCLVWNCATSLYVFCSSAWHWNYCNYYFFTQSCFFSVFSSRKWIQRSFVLVFHFVPEKEKMKIIRHTRRSDNENDVIIKTSRIYSDTVLLLHHSTRQPSTELTDPTARRKSHHILPGQTYLEQSIFPMTQRWLGEIRQLQVSLEQSDIAADFIFRS